MTNALDDQAAYDAARRVALCRQRLDHVRRQFMRREAGASDVARAEHQLAQALDRLDRLHDGHRWQIQ